MNCNSQVGRLGAIAAGKVEVDGLDLTSPSLSLSLSLSFSFSRWLLKYTILFMTWKKRDVISVARNQSLKGQEESERRTDSELRKSVMARAGRMVWAWGTGAGGGEGRGWPRQRAAPRSQQDRCTSRHLDPERILLNRAP